MVMNIILYLIHIKKLVNEIGNSTGEIGMKNFDMEFYIKRNEDTAKRLYGNRLDENRRVKGTNIWFDAYWRIHTN